MYKNSLYQELLNNNNMRKNWKLGDRIGSGSFGDVYAIHFPEKHKYDKGDYVIKIVDTYSNFMIHGFSSQYTYDEYLKKSELEFNLFDDMEQKNAECFEHLVVPEMWFEEIDKNDHKFIFILMEKMKNNLELYKDIYFPYDEVHVIDLMIQICDGLSALHNAKSKNHDIDQIGILHRDIKPDNIYFSYSIEQKKNIFKLGDMGMCRRIRSKDNCVSSTINTKNIFYSCPESFSDDTKLDVYADIYSLGAVLYYLTNNYKQINQIREIIYKERPENASDKLWEIIQTAMAYDKQDRYTSAEELKKALYSALESAKRNTLAAQLKDTNEKLNKLIEESTTTAEKNYILIKENKKLGLDLVSANKDISFNTSKLENLKKDYEKISKKNLIILEEQEEIKMQNKQLESTIEKLTQEKVMLESNYTYFKNQFEILQKEYEYLSEEYSEVVNAFVDEASSFKKLNEELIAIKKMLL